MSKRDLKIIAGTITVVGILLSILKFLYSPDYVESPDNQESVFQTDIFDGLVILVTSLAPIIYIALDYFEYRERKARKKKVQGESSRESSGES